MEFYSAKKVEQIIDHLFIDTYKSNNIKIGVNDMTVNDREMCVRWRRSLGNTGDINPEIAYYYYYYLYLLLHITKIRWQNN